MQNEALFKQLERELRSFKPLMGKASDSIINEGVSKYPIFIVHKGEIEMGISIVDHNKNIGEWSINASILEEFTAKQLIKEDKIENFQNIFKEPESYLCLFVLSEAGANFIFLPRQSEDLSQQN